MGDNRGARLLVILGILLMLAGAADPLEGSVLIAAGSVLGALGVRLGERVLSRPVCASAVLATGGVGWLFVLSAMGGIGGDTGRPVWWALTLLPYPAGWALGLVCLGRALRAGSGEPR